MKYCKIKQTKNVVVSVPEVVARIKTKVMGVAYDYNAFAENLGTVVDAENGNNVQINVYFPEEAAEDTVKAFCDEVEGRIEKALAEAS